MENYEPLIDTLVLPDPDDRHVLAAAIAGSAATLVTFNLRDFPAKTLTSYRLVALPPDPFVCGLYAARPLAVVSAVGAMRRALHNPPKSREEYLDGLRRNHLSGFAELMETHPEI